MPIAASASQKDQQMTRYYHHILPKPPPLHHNGQLSPSPFMMSIAPHLQGATGGGGGGGNGGMFTGQQQQQPTMSGLGGGGLGGGDPCAQDLSGGLGVVNGGSGVGSSMNPLITGHRQLSPPLTVQVAPSSAHLHEPSQVQNSMGGGVTLHPHSHPHHHHHHHHHPQYPQSHHGHPHHPHAHPMFGGTHTPPGGVGGGGAPPLLNLSPGLNSASIDHSHPRSSPSGYDLREMTQRRSLQELHSNVGPPQMTHSPVFYPGMCEDPGRKSESPSRKRRRTSMSTHNVMGDVASAPTPPPPLPSTRSWDMMMIGDRGGLGRRRNSVQRRGPPVILDQVNASRNRRSPTVRRVRYRDRQSPERRAFQPPPPPPNQIQPNPSSQAPPPPPPPPHNPQMAPQHHHPLPPHLTFHPANLPSSQQHHHNPQQHHNSLMASQQQQHHHHHHHHQQQQQQQQHQHHHQHQQQSAPPPVVINMDQVQVSIPLTMSPHSLPLYSTPHPIPMCANPHLPPCNMQAMHNCGGIQFSNCQVPHLAGCGIHLPHHHHHHHMYQSMMHPHSHQHAAPTPAQSNLMQQQQFITQQPMQAQSQDGGEFEMLSDHHHHHLHHHHHHHPRSTGFPGLPPPPPGVHHPGPTLPPTPPLHLIQESAVRSSPPEAHFPTLCSYVPHSRRLNSNRRAPGRRWRGTPLPTSPASYPGFLLHFFAMFSNHPSLPTYGQEMVNPETAEAENYEALLNLAERLGEAKPRGLLKTEIEQLPSYRFNAETHQSDQTSCVICMCDFEQRQLLRVLPCNHEFHAKCVDKWLKTNRTCPICRGDASEYFNHSE